MSLIALLLAAAVVATVSQPATTPTAPQPKGERVVVETAEQKAEWSPRLARMIKMGTLRLREERARGTGRDQWFVQLHKGVPVVGGEVWRRIEGGALVAAEGVVFGDIGVSPVPKLTRPEILELVSALVPGTLGPSRPPELMILPAADGTFALVYRTRVFSGTSLTTYYLDAASGAVVVKEEAPSAPPPDPR